MFLEFSVVGLAPAANVLLGLRWPDCPNLIAKRLF